MVEQWHNRHGTGLMMHSSPVRSLAIPLPPLGDPGGPRQVVHTHVPLFIKQYKLLPAKDGDALKLGR